ncbi:MAG: biotin/lipoyl-binding protein [Rhodospirillales bacterium]|nr:biotin/lipoyl-binding protein [Rhodospirillales bacterium]
MKKMRITVEGKAYDVTVEVLEDTDTGMTALPSAPPATSAPAPAAVAAPSPPSASPAPAAAGAGDIPSPLAGTVVSIDVAVGDSVNAGDQVLVLEAMKMNNAVQAPTSGTVTAIAVKPGETVGEGQALLTLG